MIPQNKINVPPEFTAFVKRQYPLSSFDVQIEAMWKDKNKYASVMDKFINSPEGAPFSKTGGHENWSTEQWLNYLDTKDPGIQSWLNERRKAESPEGKEKQLKQQKEQRFNQAMEKYLPGWMGDMTDKSREAWYNTARAVANNMGYNNPEDIPEDMLDSFGQAVTSPEAREAVAANRNELRKADDAKKKELLNKHLAVVATIVSLGALPPGAGALDVGKALAPVGTAAGVPKVDKLGKALKIAGGEIPELDLDKVEFPDINLPRLPDGRIPEGKVPGTSAPGGVPPSEGGVSLDQLWKDLLGTGISLGSEAAFQFPKQDDIRDLYKQRLQDIADYENISEQQAQTGKTRAEEDYQTRQEQIARSKHFQKIQREDELIRRGVEPKEESSIGESEWRRFNEDWQGTEQASGRARSRSLEDIEFNRQLTAQKAKEARTGAKERFEAEYPTWRSILEQRTGPEALAGMLKEYGSKLF